MKLPFSQSEFFAVFAAYNSAVWPVQLLLVGFGVLIVGAALRPRPWSSRLASWICLLYTSPSPRDRQKSRMPSSA